MEIRIDAWGFVFESGVFDLYIQRSAIVGMLAIYVAVKTRQIYLARKRKNEPAKSPRVQRKTTEI